ncbi:unnamed protein product [Diamesa serratosioi]
MFTTKLSSLLSILIILTVLTKGIKLDCGCSHTNREERAKKYERIEEGFNENEETGSIMTEASEFEKMTLIPDGTYSVGTNEEVFETDKEGPEREVVLEKFYLDKYEVSNADFEKFVIETEYVTEAETFGDSFVFKILLDEKTQKEYEAFRVAAAPWWYKVREVYWRQPEGAGSSIDSRMNHPVIHVSWNDANKFCQWKNKRLPTEAEWEAACRGNKKGKLFPWGNKLMPKDQHWMNIWQGNFPDSNSADDGSISTCPIDKFRQNDYDIYNIVGNVWEWTSDLWNPSDTNKENPDRVKKGGSYLCHISYCYRYRCAARSQNSQDSSSGNLGFRCAKDFH